MNVDTSKYPIAVNAVFDAFGICQIRIVGGCVRDLILGVQPKDWDMCTPFKPNVVTMILEDAGYKPFDLSNGHGTVSVVIDGEVVEITTLRIDAETDGRHAKVEFVEDFKLDAERRDFTFNAMSADRHGNVYDYFYGCEDLLNLEVIRFVGDTRKRIEEDYLRILRYYRFAQRFNLTLAPRDQAVITELAPRLRQISGERIWSEMKKILVGPNVDTWINWMDSYGVLEAIGFDVRKD